jgi:hypothetical protein
MLGKITRAGSIALVLVGATLAALVLSPGTAPVAGVLFPGAMIDRPTLTLFERSCQNCHSESTQWPWYSRIPPASWIIAKDIREARSQVNFSNWNSYSAEGRQDLLTRIGSMARTGRMPPSRYTFLHHEAILTPQERQQIYEWCRAEKKRLRSIGGFAPGLPR